MARKSLQDLSGIAKTIANSSPGPKDRITKTTAPALGALQGSLSAIRELDPALIDDWGPKDRLDGFTAVNSEDDGDGFETLKSSIKDDGQQVPILVRRAGTEGRFEIIYGRRRLHACRDLGLKVRANVQDLDDATALLAKGLENAARRNLSFYEKARFAAVIQAAGHNTKTVRQVLSLSASGLSHLTKVTDNIPDDVGDQIGAAPKSGRPKWTALAEAFASKKVNSSSSFAILSKLSAELSSDDRLEQLMREITRRGARPSGGREATPVPGVTIKSGRGSIAMSIKRAGENAAFAEWLDRELEDIIKKSYQEFTAVNPADDTRG
ncbi:plasmid partitioning protein RepB [Sulfitobacter geojensis]|uniref:Plasmid partitioning protein RepB n=1 Tax=Sulfitobacter geojensis TaxID=1342299 RepID=A0AAE2W0Q9_9RHOB|nr:plasmid partitioning protein RepB [Sulfitobacter geojensis]MBM1691145.1 plasmid partitioning protein RepB [Sulfitobacter geojensis]MBM1695211.1 plasmid partitioning protein RepB [Sulfitobacter geojensis]MBM1707311.1 plasmid partitioning protein RepB [Sulfitobacter geojensis]MBM1711461.1 plasmid partitioning protein RepB [Sulfitobacter geojensis]MBM1715436.1 plasmid partitioning protein RepB [Sulfitobacter geojensis]